MPVSQLAHVQQHYVESGHGPERVVLVHGFQASARIWQPVQERLPARVQSIAVNNRGAGQTTAPTDEAAYGCQPFADDLFELVTQLGWRDFTLVGHSMGGGTVLQFAIDHPHLLKALVLLDPVSPNGLHVEGDLDAAIEARMQSRRALPRGSALAGLHHEAPDLPDDFLGALAADMEAAPEQRLRGSFRSMATLRLGAAAATLPMPVLLMGGDQDNLVPLSNMLATYALLPPGSGLQIWHGVGHDPNLARPDSLVETLMRFVEVTAPARRQAAGAA